MIYDESKSILFFAQIQNYYKSLELNKQYTTVDVILPKLIEESNKTIVLNHKDIVKATIVWKSLATEYIALSIIQDKYKTIELLNDEIKFQNYLWNKRWKEYASQ